MLKKLNLKFSDFFGVEYDMLILIYKRRRSIPYE